MLLYYTCEEPIHPGVRVSKRRALGVESFVVAVGAVMTCYTMGDMLGGTGYTPEVGSLTRSRYPIQTSS